MLSLAQNTSHKNQKFFFFAHKTLVFRGSKHLERDLVGIYTDLGITMEELRCAVTTNITFPCKKFPTVHETTVAPT